MTAYLIARVEVIDPNLLKEYMVATPPILAKYSGKFLARGGKTVTFEGPEESRRIVIIEFPSLADAGKYFHSLEYSEARKLRQGAAIGEFIALDGV